MKVFGHYVYLPIVLLIAGEFSIAVVTFLAVEFFYQDPGEPWRGPPWFWVIAFGLTVIVGLTAVGLYQAKQRLRIEGVLARVIVGMGIGAVSLAVVNFLFPIELGGSLWASSYAVCALALAVTRIIVWRWLDHDAFRRRVLVFGAGRNAAKLLKLRRRTDRRGFSIEGFVPTEGDEVAVDAAQVRHVEGTLFDYAQRHAIDEIVVAMDDRRRGFPVSELLDCKFGGIAVVELIDFLERETGKINIDLVNPSWLIFSERFGAAGPLRIGTRVIDLVVSAMALVVASPVMLLIALAILIDDGAPVLYRQRRIGVEGKPFTLFKFRSMRRDAEAAGPQWAQTGDSRVTRMGAILRKLRLDELPQFFNVLAGSMSLVGPRPERPEFVERLAQQIPYYQERHIVKPGITGWAQLSYPYGASDHDAMEKLQYDLYYIKHKSLVLDLMILLQTAEVIMWGKGAR